MDKKESKGTFEQTAEFQEKYKSLLTICDKEGTMILQDRVLETDLDIAPYKFIRRGTREYVFPQQEVTIKEDKSRVIDPSAKYGIHAEDHTFNFDEEQVKGRIRIEYIDSDNIPHFKVIDVLGESEIPGTVGKSLDDIFN